MRKLVELDLFVLSFIQNYDLLKAFQLILRTLLRMCQAQIAKKIRTFSSGLASAKKFDVRMKKKKSVNHVPLNWFSERKLLIMSTDYLLHNCFIFLRNQKRPPTPLSHNETSKRPHNAKSWPFLKFRANGLNVNSVVL